MNARVYFDTDPGTQLKRGLRPRSMTPKYDVSSSTMRSPSLGQGPWTLETQLPSTDLSGASLFQRPVQAATVFLIWGGSSGRPNTKIVEVGVGRLMGQREKNRTARRVLESWLAASQEENARRREKLKILMEEFDKDREPGRKIFK